MRLYYFVHISATDQGISGIPRVVKSLARELDSMAGIELVLVSWGAERKTLVHTEQKLLEQSVFSRRPCDQGVGRCANADRTGLRRLAAGARGAPPDQP